MYNEFCWLRIVLMGGDVNDDFKDDESVLFYVFFALAADWQAGERASGRAGGQAVVAARQRRVLHFSRGPEAPLALGRIPDPVRLAFTLPMEVERPPAPRPPAPGVADTGRPLPLPPLLLLAVLLTAALLVALALPVAPPGAPGFKLMTAAAAFCFSMVQSNV